MNLSSFKQLISGFNPFIGTDTLKIPLNMNLRSAVSEFLVKFKDRIVNSYIQGSSIAQVFLDEEELLTDDSVLSEYPILNDSITDTVSEYTKEVLGTTDDMWNCLTEWFDKFGVSNTINEHDFSEVTLTLSDGSIVSLLWDGLALSTRSIINGLSTIFPVVVFDSTSHFVIACSSLVVTVDEAIVTFWGVIKDQYENSMLSEKLSELCSLCLNEQAEASIFTSSVSSWVQSTLPSIRLLGHQVSSAYAQSGMFGVISIIINYCKAPTTIVEDSGHLRFTDNLALVPQVFLSGIVSSIFNTLASTITLIIASFSRVAGLVAAGVTGVISLISSKANYDYAVDTLATLYNGFDCGIPLGPHGIFGGKALLNDAVPQIDGKGAFYLSVPGGQILITKVGSEVRQEFHPDLVDRRELFINPDSGLYIDAANTYWHSTVYIPQPTQYRIVNECENLDNSGTLSFLNDPQTLLLSEHDSFQVSQVLACNVLIYVMWCMNAKGSVEYRPGLSIYAPKSVNATDHARTVYGKVLSIASSSPDLYIFSGDGSQYQTVLPDDKMVVWQLGRLAWVVKNSFDDIGGDEAALADRIWTELAIFASYAAGNQTGDAGLIPYLTISSGGYPGITEGHLFTVKYGFDPYYIPRDSLASQDYLIWSGPNPAPSQVKWAVQVPKYLRSTYWQSINTAIATTVAITIVGVAATIAGSIYANNKYRQLTASCEKKWDAVKADPKNKVAIRDYKRACLKANFFAALTGNSAISNKGFWNAGSDTPAKSGDSALKNNIVGLLAGEEVSTMGAPVSSNDLSLADILTLISGV